METTKVKANEKFTEETIVKENASNNYTEFRFKKRLIVSVRHQRNLYDLRHACFSDERLREKSWLKIAQRLCREVPYCKSAWADLLYDYKRYVRRLQDFYKTGIKYHKRRPVMALETDMMFLYHIVTERSKTLRCRLLPYKKAKKNSMQTTLVEAVVSHDDDIVVLEEEPVVIDLDNEEATGVQIVQIRSCSFTLTTENRRLVDVIRVYPELYNPRQRFFKDFHQRGFIWNAIATELGEKATKLMKSWIVLQMRYEWLLNSGMIRNADDVTLEQSMRFLKAHIQKNTNTVYKQSYFLQKEWHNPIDHFRSIFGLILALKKYPKVVQVTEDMLTKKHQNGELYAELWNNIAKVRGAPAGQCEITWLIMRSFYWELIYMRKQGYQLQDKWYFETTISDLYVQISSLNSSNSEKTHKGNSQPIVSIDLDDDEESPIVDSEEVSCGDSLLQSQNSLKPSVVLPKVVSAQSLAMPVAISNDSNVNFVMAHEKSVAPTHDKGPADLPINLVEVNHILSMNATLMALPQAAAPLTVPFSSTLPTAIIKPTQPPVCTALLPKITNAVSILNPNEIMIELIGSPSGNQVVVHGPPILGKYSLSMTKTASFIREVMAIPLLHNKLYSDRVSHYYQYLSKKFDLPVHICKALWNFLTENFRHFPQIAPMKELMQPFDTDLNVWTESNVLFSEFEKAAEKLNLRKYNFLLPHLMETVGKCPKLYLHLSTHMTNVTPTPAQEQYEIWNNIHQNLKATVTVGWIMETWTRFKNVFWSYMTDLERGVDNRWPFNWWCVLEKMSYLINLRYHDMEPFYYIVRNKVLGEVKRCLLMTENSNNSAKEDIYITSNSSPTHPTITQILSPAVLPTSTLPATYLTPLAPVTLPLPSINIQDPLLVENLETLSSSPSVSLKQVKPITQHVSITVRNDLFLRMRPTSEIDAYNLLQVIRGHSLIYQKCSKWERVEAWKQVSLAMNATVATCQLTFQRALKRFRLSRARDPAGRCRMAQKYFKPLNDIYRHVKMQRKLNIRTPTELNQTIIDKVDTEIAFPERFIPEINMDKNKPKLVLKNWVYAIGNLPITTQKTVQVSLRAILNNYRHQAVTS